MYEQVSRWIQLICCLAASLKFISSVPFVVAVDGVGFNFNRHFSSSVCVVVDTKLFDPFLSMCEPVLSLLLSTDFSSYCQFYLWKRFLFNLVDIIFGLVDMELSCGMWILFYFKLNVCRNVTNDTRVKNVRKAEPLAAPEKKIKRTKDDALPAESKTERKAGDGRSDESRARRKAKHKQRQRARKASFSCSQNKTEVDGSQEAEETEGSGLRKTSTEDFRDLN